MPGAVRTPYWGTSLPLSNITQYVWMHMCAVCHTRHTERSEDSEEPTIRAT